MAVLKCDKCGEMVDEAKAFCPGCGAAFVEEIKREDKSRFETLDNTVQLGNMMYDQMLSDMGLNVAKAREKPEKRIEIIAQIQTKAAPGGQSTAAAVAAKPSRTLWIVLGVLGLLVLLPFAVVSIVILVRALMARF